jgi:hypothetical protein
MLQTPDPVAIHGKPQRIHFHYIPVPVIAYHPVENPSKKPSIIEGDGGINIL